MENFFVELGLSYVLSKLFAFLIMIGLGSYFFFLIGKKLLLKRRIFRVLVQVLVLVAPFCFYFAISPIYQGDLGDASRPTKLRSARTTELDNGLMVLTIPGCSYCKEAILMLKDLKKNGPDLKIQLYVCETSDVHNLKDFEKDINGDFPIDLLMNPTAILSETSPSFPLFISVEDGTAVKFWTNNEFGAHAKDYLIERSKR